MVNKCSLVGCRSLYTKNKVKLHRFPLGRKTILSLWIAFTGKESYWVPGISSRLCCNHFIESDYMINHRKGVLKPTAVPSIQYRVIIPVNCCDFECNQRYRRKNVRLYPIINQIKDLNQLIKVEHIMEQVNDSIHHDQTDELNEYYLEPYQGNGHVNIKSKTYTNYACDRKNQCYELTESFIRNCQIITPKFIAESTKVKNFNSNRNNSTFINSLESTKSRIVIPPNKNYNRSYVDIKEQTKNIIFNGIKNLKFKKRRCTQTIYSLYFNSPIIRRILAKEESKLLEEYKYSETIF